MSLVEELGADIERHRWLLSLGTVLGGRFLRLQVAWFDLLVHDWQEGVVADSAEHCHEVVEHVGVDLGPLLHAAAHVLAPPFGERLVAREVLLDEVVDGAEARVHRCLLGEWLAGGRGGGARVRLGARSFFHVWQHDELGDGHEGVVGQTLGVDDQLDEVLEARAGAVELAFGLAAALVVQVVAFAHLEEKDSVFGVDDAQVDVQLLHVFVVEVLLVFADGVDAVHFEGLEKALEVENVGKVEVRKENDWFFGVGDEFAHHVEYRLLLAHHEWLALELPVGVPLWENLLEFGH